ncbi:MAG TPA: ATP-binding protein, partial [Anaeromyxobacteraceae bacterium]|nr:ATP-binding protein [Anaeromyxobacteraceae bacterium]
MRTPPARGDAELRQLLLRASIYPVLLMVGVGTVLAWQILKQRDLFVAVDRTDRVIGLVNEIAFLQIEHENGLRGFLLTGELSFLAPYVAAESPLGRALSFLERLVADNPEEVAKVHRLRELNENWRRLAAVALARREGDGRSMEQVAAREAAMEEVRSLTRSLREAEERTRAQRFERAARAARLVLVSSVGLALIFGAVLAWLARAQVRRVAFRYRVIAREAGERADRLAVSEERFRLFVEGVRDAAIFMLEPDGRVRSWNVGAERIEGYRPEEIVGRHLSVFYTPEDADEGIPQRELARAADEGEIEAEGWRLRKGGQRFWAAVTLRALRGKGGQLVGYAKLVRDTTERRWAEMQRAAQYGLARVLNEVSSPVAAWAQMLEAVAPALGYDFAVAWAPQGEELAMVQSWLRPSGPGESFLSELAKARPRRGQGVVGEVWSTGAPVWVEDTRRELHRSKASLAMEAGLLSVVAFPVRAGGEIALIVELFASDPRPRDAGLLELAAILGVQMGIYLDKRRAEDAVHQADRRRAEDLERRVAERTIELTAVNRELEAFSYSVSHDLRAPLRAMDGFSQVLLEDYADRVDDAGKDYLRRIRAACQRLSQLIDDLIQLSRLTRAELRCECIDLSVLFREVTVEVQEREPRRRVAVHVEDGVLARGDPRLLRVGLVNLVSNAFKFTRHKPDPRVEFGVTETNGCRVYHVRDNGAGFDMSYAHKLFQPFQRLHGPREFEGTGIGLATCQRIVQRHGGTLWAEGAPEQGASFFFTLG